MVIQVKVAAGEFDDQSLIPGAHRGEEENPTPSGCLWPSYTHYGINNPPLPPDPIEISDGTRELSQ